MAFNSEQSTSNMAFNSSTSTNVAMAGGGKWRDSDMEQFLDLYQQHEILWNPRLKEYKSSEARSYALQNILSIMKIPNFSEPDLKAKIKNIRTTYSRELGKLVKSVGRDGKSVNGYKPVLVWFEKADSFLREVTESRGSASISDVSNQTVKVKEEVFTNDASENEDISAETYTPTNTKLKRKVRKKFRPIHSTQGMVPIENALSKLEKISQANTTDEFDVFAKHIASQLRQLPIGQAIVCQLDVQSVLTQARISALTDAQDCPSDSNVSTSNCTIKRRITNPYKHNYQ